MLLPNGGFIEILRDVVYVGGLRSFWVGWTRGHAVEEDIARGVSNLVEMAGINGADAIATSGIEHHGLECALLAKRYSMRIKAYHAFVSFVQRYLCRAVREGKEARLQALAIAGADRLLHTELPPVGKQNLSSSYCISSTNLGFDSQLTIPIVLMRNALSHKSN